MNDPIRLLALSGSLRQASFNTRLAQLMASCAPQRVTVEVATCHGVPLYDGDVEENEGIPAPVEAMRERIRQSHGLILVTPEYNGAMPGVFKNTLDWLTRPPEQMVPTFRGRPTALAGATPGGLGTTLAQAGSLVVLRQLKVRLYPEHLRVSGAAEQLPESGSVPDGLRDQVQRWLEGFCEFVCD
ncbi:MAG: NADPH-dependent FMN reductase [Wenzhouxiangellaceae bacterium]